MIIPVSSVGTKRESPYMGGGKDLERANEVRR